MMRDILVELGQLYTGGDWVWQSCPTAFNQPTNPYDDLATTRETGFNHTEEEAGAPAWPHTYACATEGEAGKT
jgi:hypothetical protein